MRPVRGNEVESDMRALVIAISALSVVNNVSAIDEDIIFQLDR